MSLRRTLRALLRVSVVGSFALAVLALPIRVGVDVDDTVTAPPLASSLLLGGSSSLLAIAGCLLRKRYAAQGIGAKPFA